MKRKSMLLVALVLCAVQAQAADSLNCRLVGRCYVSSPRLWGCAVAGDYAYVGHDTSGVLVFDVSDPTNPAIVAVCRTARCAQHLVVDGNYLYVADGNDMCVVDVSNPTSPAIVGECSSGGWALGITKVGNYAYVANYSLASGLVVINVSDPANPVRVGSCNTPWYASGVSVSGDYAYVAIQDSGMSVIDVSDPTDPFQVARYDSSGSTKFICERTSVSGHYAYLAEKSEVVVFDITDPPNLQKVGLGVPPVRWTPVVMGVA